MFDLFIDSACRVTESMRFNDIEQTNDRTRCLYALITDNHSLYTRLIKDMQRVDISNEMKYFATQRSIFVLQSICNHIKNHFNLKNHVIEQKYSFKINGSVYDKITINNRHELEKLEYDIDQLILIAERSSQTILFEKEQYDFTSDTMFNRFHVLKYLIDLLEANIGINQTPYMRNSSKYIINTMNDSGSLKCLIILSYLITKVALSLYKAGGSFDYVSVKERKHRMIESDYSIIVNYGTMSITNVLCCFKNLEFIKIIAENENGSSSQQVRTFLYNLMILDKMLK